MDLWGSLIENSTIHQPIRQPNYSSYVVLRKVGRNNSVSYCPSTEDLEPLTSFKRKRRVVYGCKHFPEVEAEAKANWSCEFCGGARLIEHATRSNEVVLSLEINELLRNFYANYESSDEAMSPVNSARASKSTWTKSPSPEMTEEPEGAMAVNTIDESTSLSLDSVDCELPLFEQLTYDDVRETKTCEISLCSSPRMEETSCTERGSPPHIASACSSLWSSDSTERSCNISDRESLNWDLQEMQYEHRRHKQSST